MLYLKLFLVFSKIGILNFGGGYAMLGLIHNEVVEKESWLTSSQFADIVAISQSTPGPIGINCATYTGYQAGISAGLSQGGAILGAVIASLSVMWLPFILMMCILKLFASPKPPPIEGALEASHSSRSTLHNVVVGLIAAVAVQMMNVENFGNIHEDRFLVFCSILICLVTFVCVRYLKLNPILMILLSGLLGLIIY